MRKLKIFFVTLICLLSSNIAYTLGVGDIRVSSALNQPLDAEIKLFSVRSGDVEGIRVTLGSLKDFANAGIERPLVLSYLKFKVIDNQDGSASIKVTSTKPIKEPFLDFLIEVDWTSGHLVREYTMLLDPPVFAQRKAAPIQAPAVRTAAPAAMEEPAPQVAAPAPFVDSSDELFPRMELGAVASEPVSRAPVTAAGEAYKVKRNDTLWSIASSLRPDSSIEIEQVMMALLRNNPQAFTNGNVNGLKSGFILRIPERDMIEAIDAAEAIRLTREQNELWRNAREAISRGETPTGTQGEAAPSSRGSSAADEPAVRLVTPKQADSKDTAQGAGAGSSDSAEEVALISEQLASKEQENTDLKGRVSALQDQIDSMERLLNLKEESLAELQNKLAAPVTAAAPEVAPVVEEPASSAVGDEAQVEKKSTGNKLANPFALDETVKTEIPAVKPQAPRPITQPAVSAAPVEPVADEGLFGLVKDLLNNVVILAVLVAVMIGLLALIWLIQRRRMAAAQFPESILTGKPGGGSGSDSVAAEETSLLSDFAPSAMGGAIESEVGEVDPLSEADVYIAYNKHQQAVELLNSAIEQEPERLDLKLKLMEVYHSARNAEAFLALASELHEAKGDQNAALWGKAMEMGRDLCPDNEMFRDAAAELEDDFSDLQGIAGLDELEADFDESLSEEISSLDIPEIEVPAAENEPDVLDLDVEDAPVEELTDLASDMDELSLDSFDMPELEEEAAGGDLGELDLSAFDEAASVAEPAAEQAPAAEFDLGELDLELDEAMAEEPLAGMDMAETVEEEATAEDDEVLGLDEVATKLDLAKAYIDMGDPDGARAILDEVMNEGNDEQKSEAQGLINEL
ncbi:FimV/HubP family polar landmark protein [Sulfuriflexus mobilis]|uniref:FimV/HubP family polar landmark protein n=1 Tax=Sulfuriflexus mobilis TaxID=1811807 RepID=UPI000F83017F|nr:FimV/HubP family polar landmark protein [Sulfuriflexus mobilis]